MVDKILQRKAGVTSQYTPIDTTTGAASAGKIIATNAAGKLDDTFLPAGLGDGTRTSTASEALVAGNFVQEYANAGVWSVRKADNSNGRYATGYVKTSVASAALATVYPLDGVNDALSGLTVGTRYFLGTAGAVIATPLDTTATGNVGYIDQLLGFARSATELVTDDHGYIVI